MAYRKLIVLMLIIIAAVTLFSVLTYKGEKKDCSAECSEEGPGCSIGCDYLNFIRWMAQYRTYSAVWLIMFASVLYLIMIRH